MIAYTKAERLPGYIKMFTYGPSGAGKSYTSIGLATYIAAALGKRCAVIDTEVIDGNKPKSHYYADRFDFDLLLLAGDQSPEAFIEAIHAAEDAGYGALVIDTVTHEWYGAKGCLAEVDRIAREKFKGNSHSAWSIVTPRHDAFIDAVKQARIHIFMTARAKDKTAQVRDENGKTQVIHLGMLPMQRSGIEYEFPIVAQMSEQAIAFPASICSELVGKSFATPGRKLGDILLRWAAGNGPQVNPETGEIADAKNRDTIEQEFESEADAKSEVPHQEGINVHIIKGTLVDDNGEPMVQLLTQEHGMVYTDPLALVETGHMPDDALVKIDQYVYVGHDGTAIQKGDRLELSDIQPPKNQPYDLDVVFTHCSQLFDDVGQMKRFVTALKKRKVIGDWSSTAAVIEALYQEAPH